MEFVECFHSTFTAQQNMKRVAEESRIETIT